MSGTSHKKWQDQAYPHRTADHLVGLGKGDADPVTVRLTEERSCLPGLITQRLKDRTRRVHEFRTLQRRSGPVRHADADPVARVIPVQEPLVHQIRDEALHRGRRQAGTVPGGPPG